MSQFVSFFVVVIALLASFTLYRQGPSDIYLRLFPPFLSIVTVVLGICSYLAARIINNMPLFNPLTIFQYCFYFFLLYRIIRQPVVRKIAFHLIWIYPLIAGLNILLYQKINTFHTITYSLGGLLVVALCIFYFFELFQRPQSVNLTRNPDFWICSGLLFYFSCSFPLYGMANNLGKMPRFIIVNLNSIFNVLDILLYTSLVIAFLCRLKIRKSSL
ncbi:hypothetical protein [Puia dinghuensis]|uniref:Uncharacterized protein n=1 Tax=Puia dinghuensis TaxID=1792502 RepID=A0A8J2UG91_9BACT|nr:hypothetical protein [Puia dinghuensis]GGB13464.1 hypothetical protein GCM10011511_41440 [Puia dinghuensis]